MARARQTPAAQQPEAGPPTLPPGQVADRLGVAAGVGAAAPPVAGAVSAAAITAATAKIVGGLLAFFKRRRREDAIWLRTQLRAQYPQRTTQQIETLVSDESARQVRF